jgi:acyl-CoA thioesterase II
VPIAVLVRILDLDTLDCGPVPSTSTSTQRDIFRGSNLREGTFLPTRVFGGQLIGQALVAASRTVPASQPVHSLHCSFLRPGSPAAPFLYLVDRTRDGSSFATRQVTAQQHGEVVFRMTCSFHAPEARAFSHSVAMPADVPHPEDLPTQTSRLRQATSNPALPAHVKAALVQRAELPFPLDFRQVVRPPSTYAADTPASTRTCAWFCAPMMLPDDPALHRCVAAYGSDLALLETALVPHRRPGHKGRLTSHMASLDHSMWFHAPFRADEWLLMEMESPAASGGTGLATGRLWNSRGVLVASVAQEGLIRPRQTAKL